MAAPEWFVHTARLAGATFPFVEAFCLDLNFFRPMPQNVTTGRFFVRNSRDARGAKFPFKGVKHMSLFKKIDCVSLTVADLDAGIAFYERLGHVCAWREAGVAAGLRLSDADTEIVLHVKDLPAETYFLVDSVAAAIGEIVKAGGKLEIGPFEIEAGLYARLRDPWGNPLVIMDLSKGTLKTDSSGTVIGNNSVK